MSNTKIYAGMNLSYSEQVRHCKAENAACNVTMFALNGRKVNTLEAFQGLKMMGVIIAKLGFEADS
jgi:hypothetical protein